MNSCIIKFRKKKSYGFPPSCWVSFSKRTCPESSVKGCLTPVDLEKTPKALQWKKSEPGRSWWQQSTALCCHPCRAKRTISKTFRKGDSECKELTSIGFVQYQLMISLIRSIECRTCTPPLLENIFSASIFGNKYLLPPLNKKITHKKHKRVFLKSLRWSNTVSLRFQAPPPGDAHRPG